MKSAQARSGILLTLIGAVALACLPVEVEGANGTAYYFDENGATAGFYTAPLASPYANGGTFWSTSSAGTATTVAQPNGAQLTFGTASSSDLDGLTFTVTLSTGTRWSGLLIDDTANITFNGIANAYLGNTGSGVNDQTWTVAAGSTFTMGVTWNGFGLNYDNDNVTLQGGGTINFDSDVGYNSTSTINQNMSGGTVNMRNDWSAGAANQSSYTLTAGTLNFGSSSANVFNGMQAGRLFSINGGTINNTSGASMTLGLGSGTYSIGGSFTFTGSSSLNFGTAAVALAATPTLTVNNNMLTLGGNVSGSFGLTKGGAGTLTLSGNNAYTGTTTINAGGGTLMINSINALGATSGATTIKGNSTGNGQLVLAGGVSFAAEPLTLEARQGAADAIAALVSQSGDNTWNGAITLTTGGATYRIQSDAGLMTLAGDITQSNSGSRYLNLQGVGNGVLSGRYLSSGGSDTGTTLTKGGSGTWTLTGVNTYLGATTITAGTLQLGDGGTTGSIASSASLANNGTLVFNRSNVITQGTDFPADISGAGSLEKLGAGTLTLSGANTYSGKTTVSAGALSFDSLANVGAASSALGAPTTAANGTIDVAGTLIYTGGAASSDRIVNSIGGATLYNSGSGLLTLSGGVTGTGNLSIRGNGSITESGAVTHAGALSRTDSGTLTLSNAGNSFGNVSVSKGMISVNSIANAGVNCALGAGSTITLGQSGFNNTGTLQFTGGAGGSSDRAISILSNSGNTNGGIIENTVAGQTLALSGNVTTGGTGTTPSLELIGSGNGALSGNISGTGLTLTKDGAGTWTLSGNNSYDGDVTITAGALRISTSTALGTGTKVVVANNGTTGNCRLHLDGSGGDISLPGTISFQTSNGGSPTLENLAGNNTIAGAITLTSGGGNTRVGVTGGTLTLSGNIAPNTTSRNLILEGAGVGTASGVISGAMGLIKNGNGTWTLSNANTYSNATTVSGGTLALQGTTASPTISIDGGSVLQLDGAIANGADTTFSGTGTLRKTGSGNLVWGSATATFALGSGALIDVQGGTFTGGSYANEDWTANLSDLNVGPGAVFAGVEANVRVDALSGTGTITSGYNGSGYVNFTFGVDNGSGTFSGVLANGSYAGIFVKGGSGTQTLSGANTFTGSLNINTGVVCITTNTALGAGTKTIYLTNGSNGRCQLHLDGTAGDIVLPETISFQTSNSLDPTIANLAGDNTINGSITLTSGGGSTRVAASGGTLTLAGNVAPSITGRTLILEGSAAGTVSGVISGTGANFMGLTKNGSGTWTLTAANAYTGVTTVTAGKLITTTASAGAGAYSVTGGTLGVRAAAAGGTLAMDSLTVASSTKLDLNLGGFGNPANPLINVAGALTSSATVTNNIQGGNFSVGQFPLIRYGSSSGFNFALGTLPRGVIATLVDNSGGQSIDLNITDVQSPVWQGNVNTAWDIDTTANWTLGGSPGTYVEDVLGNDSVRFDDTASGTTAVALNTTVNPAAVVFTNATKSYTLGGTGRISGTTSLLKHGSGSLTIATANDFSGGTTVNGGTLVVTNSAALGDGVIADNAELLYHHSDSQTVNNVISGTGMVTQRGAGTLALGGNNTYAGLTTVSGGKLQVADNNALGGTAGGTKVQGGPGALSYQGSVLELLNGRTVTGETLELAPAAGDDGGTMYYRATLLADTGNTATWSGPVTLSGGTNIAQFTAGGTLTVSGPIGGSLTGTELWLRGGGSGTIAAAGVTSIGTTTLGKQDSGTWTINSTGNVWGDTRVYSGTLVVGADSALPAASLVLVGSNATATLKLNGTDQTIGGLVDGGTGTHRVTGGNATLSSLSISTGTGVSTTFAGILGGTGANDNNLALIKLGAGTQTLSANGTMTGAVTVDRGSLVYGADQTTALSGLTFGASAGSANYGALDLTAASLTASSLTVRNNNATANTLTIGSGKTLAINGNVTIGANTGTAVVTKLTATGASGTLTITKSGGSFQMGAATGSNQDSTTVDLSGLGTVTVDLGSGGTLRLGDQTSGSVTSTQTLTLGATSTIRTGTLGIGDNSSNAGLSSIRLGSGTQVINANTINIGLTNTQRSFGSLTFNGGTGTIRIRAYDNASAANLNMMTGATATGTLLQNTLDVTGHSADLLFGTVNLMNAGSPRAAYTSTFSFDTGTLTAGTLTIGTRTGTDTDADTQTATVNIGSAADAVNTATLGVVTMANNTSTATTAGGISGNLNITGDNTTAGLTSLSIASASAASGTGTATGALNISGGATTVSGSIVLASRTGANTATVSGTIGITGGSLTVGGNITAAGTVTSSLTLNGGMLDMTGGTIGDATTLIGTLNFQSGTLRNVGEINGGAGLTKTTAGTLTLDTANTYTGATTIHGGTLVVRNTAACGAAGQTVYISTTTGSGTLQLSTDSSVNAYVLYTSSSNPGTVISDRATPGAGITHVLGNMVLGNNTYSFSQGTNVTSGTAGVQLASMNLSAGSAGTCTMNPTTADLTVIGGVSIGSNNFAKSLALGGTSGGSLISGVIANGLNTLTLIKQGAGTWTLSGVNTYTGTTTVKEGLLVLSGNRTATSSSMVVGDTAAKLATLNIQNGSFTVGGGQEFRVGNASTATGVVNHTAGALACSGGNQVLIGAGAGTGTYNLSGGSLTTAASATRGVILGVNDNGTATFNLGGTGALNMTSGGNSILQVGRSDSAAVNCTAAFNQTGGSAAVGILSVGGAAANTGTDATLNLTGGTFAASSFTVLAGAASSTAAITIGGTAQVTLPAFPTPAGTVTLTFDGGTLTPSAASATYIQSLANAYLTANGANIAVPAGRDITIAQVLKNAASEAGTLTKTGPGVLTLSGANTYSGGTSVRNGTLVLSAGNNRLLSTSSVTLGDAGTSGTLQLGDSGGARSQTLTGLAATGLGGSVVGGNASVSTLTLNIASGENVFSGTLGGSGVQNNLALTKSGAGTLTLTANNLFTGNISVGASAGDLVARHSGALGVGPKTVTVVGGGTGDRPTLILDGSSGDLTFAADLTFVTSNNGLTDPAIRSVAGNNRILGPIQLTGGGGSSAVLVDAGTLELGNVHSIYAAALRDLILGGVANGTVTGSISNNANTVTVQKEGAGTWTLTGANTYGGSTAVNAGTLEVNGTHTGAGAYTVAVGARLRGQAVLSTTSIAIDGALDAGAASDAVGTITAAGASLAFTDSTLHVDIAAGGGSADRVTVGGDVTGTCTVEANELGALPDSGGEWLILETTGGTVAGAAFTPPGGYVITQLSNRVYLRKLSDFTVFMFK